MEVKLTQNQLHLLLYINQYQRNHGKPPTFKEMVNGISISDNRSLLGIIQNLIQKRLLLKENKKSRSVRLTNDGQRLIGTTFNYTPTYSPYRLKQQNHFPEDTVTVVMSSSGTLSYEASKVGTSGTSRNGSSEPLIDSSKSGLIQQYNNGTGVQSVTDAFNKNVSSSLVQLIHEPFFLESLGWITIFIVACYAYSKIFDSQSTFLYSIISVVTIRHFLWRGE